MIKKIALSFGFILLVFNYMSFSQTENPYADFNPESLKENAKYVRNFAPNNYDEKILYACLTEMIDMARQEYAFLPVMKHDENLDSTAQFQADHMASKDEKTEENVAPYKTIFYRLRKYDLAGNGTELIAKTKAYLGEKEYSYYDLCFATVQSFLKNIKTAVVLLDGQYTYLGIGFNTDKLMKNMYLSCVLTNDRAFNYNKPGYSVKDLPYTKSSNSLKPYDDRVCKKCATEPGLEILSEYVKMHKDGAVYMECDDAKGLKKLIGKEGDAIVIDFVQQSNYGCHNATTDYNLSHRGFISKPITYEKMMSANENTNAKSNKIIAKLADLPVEISEDADVNIHILVLKEGNRVCRTIIPKKIEVKSADYEEKIMYVKDLAGIKSKGEWVATAETGDFSVTFPYDLKKTDYTSAAFASQLKEVNVPEYKVNSIEIIAHNSPNYYQDANYQKIQQKRADFLKKDLQTRYPGVDITVSYDFCYEKFKKDINSHPEYYDLGFDDLPTMARKLKNDSWALKTLDSGYLSPCRFYEIKYLVTFQNETKTEEQKFVTWKFNQALSEKNTGLAMSIENYMMDQVEKGKYTSSFLKEMQIPMKKEYQTLLNNKLYMQYFFSSKLTPEIAKEMTQIYNLNPANVLLSYNTTIGAVKAATIQSVTDIAKTQADIDKLYTIPAIPKDRANALNMEYQFKVVNYLDTVPVTTETAALKTATFAKIKEIRNHKLDSWKNAYKLASYFVKQYDYQYACSLMNPFLDDPTISEDFIFSYISIAAHREETFLSGLFTKAVQLAKDKNAPRLCGLFDKLPACVLENSDVKKIICKECR